jgi:hypothetical protein
MNCMLVIRCAQTGQEVPTGLIVDIHTFAGVPAGTSELQCPACGETHLWSIADATLAQANDTWSPASQPMTEETTSRTVCVSGIGAEQWKR